MDPIRRRMSSLLTESARNAMGALDPQSPCARELSGIEFDDLLAEEIERICRTATLAEITRIVLLVGRMKKTSGGEKDAIKSSLKSMGEKLLTRMEKESGQLKLPKACRDLLLDL